MVEAGYESFKLPSGMQDVVYFDRAPEKSEAASFLTQVPPAPPNIIPLIVLTALHIPSAIATWHSSQRLSGRSRKRRRTLAILPLFILALQRRRVSQIEIDVMTKENAARLLNLR